MPLATPTEDTSREGTRRNTFAYRDTRAVTTHTQPSVTINSSLLIQTHHFSSFYITASCSDPDRVGKESLN